MKQVRFTAGVADLVDAPDPRMPGAEEVLVRVGWAAFNGLDLLRAQNGMTAPPGLEFAGSVVSTGSRVADLSPGDEVMGLVSQGALSEYVTAPRATLIRRPGWLDERVAGAALEMMTIGHDAITQLQPEPGAITLVHGANTMVGNGIIQLLRGTDATVLGVARTLRPELPQAHHTFETMPEEWTGKVDSLVECVGPKNLEADIDIMREEGRMVLLGGMGGTRAAVDYLQVMQKRLTLIGSTFNSRPESAKRKIIAEVERTVLPKLENGEFTVPIAGTFDAGSAGEAFTLFSRGSSGKIVLSF